MLVRQRNEVSRVWVQDHKDSVKVKGHINAPLTTGQSIRRCNIRCSEAIHRRHPSSKGNCGVGRLEVDDEECVKSRPPT